MALPIVFLGPSLPKVEAEALCPGEYYGPVARGDLPRLLGPVPRVVVIIDGCFRETRAVSPKEIIEALDRGYTVYGASSIGALRAVELERFGMQGVGRVFEAFRSRELSADDEVACTFDTASLEPISEPLVCIRVALEEAVGANLLTRREKDHLLSVASGLHYPLRTYRRLVAESCLPAERQARIVRFCESEATNVKAEDARAALRRAACSTVRCAGTTSTDLPLRRRPPRPGPALAALPPSLKVGPQDSVRTMSLKETERRLGRVRSVAGITRVADVQGLDWLGVPNFVAVRPSRDGHCNSTYSGKGLRPEEARVGAQMEALEMACALDDRVTRERSTFIGFRNKSIRAVDPDSLIPFRDAPRDLKALELDWVTGGDIVSGEAVQVPADAVYFRRDMTKTYWKISSNGLAAGNSWAEAIAHGLAELIERDAETMLRLATEFGQYPGLLNAVAGPRRVPPPEDALPAPLEFPLLRLSSLPEPFNDLVQRFVDSGVRVSLRVITSDIAVPTILCALWEPTQDRFRHFLQYGCGTHPDPLIALKRAITEATQSRVTAIQGSREDLEAPAMARSDPPEEMFCGGADGIDFKDLHRSVHADVRDDIRLMIDKLKHAALYEVVAVDLSNPRLEFPVAKVIVPGLELAFHDVRDNRIPLGWRARRYFDATPEAVEPRPAAATAA